MEDKEEDHPVMKTCFEKNLPLKVHFFCEKIFTKFFATLLKTTLVTISHDASN